MIIMALLPFEGLEDITSDKEKKLPIIIEQENVRLTVNIIRLLFVGIIHKITLCSDRSSEDLQKTEKAPTQAII